MCAEYGVKHYSRACTGELSANFAFLANRDVTYRPCDSVVANFCRHNKGTEGSLELTVGSGKRRIGEVGMKEWGGFEA